MSEAVSLTTGRLLLRPWRDDDLPAFAALNADPRVMEFFPSLLDRSASDAVAGRVRTHFDTHGFGPWAIEIPGRAPFAGFVGLFTLSYETHFTPAIEILWRLDHAHWGHGYATEAARRALAFAFDERELAEIVAVTVPANARSRRVMERIGMTRSPGDDFEHPDVPQGHALRRHVLYRIRRDDWRARPPPR